MLDTRTFASTVSAPPAPGRTRLPLAAAVVGTFAAVFSLAGSWIPSLWGDEAASVLSGTRPLGSLAAMLAHVDAVHGLYYVGLHFWMEMFGSSPFAVRFPSAIAVGVCAAAVTLVCGRFGTVRFAASAGLITAILPRLTYAGEEARAYAFDAAIAAVLCVILAEIMLRREPSRRWWVAYAAVLTLGIYTFLYLGLMILVAGAVLLLSPPLRPQARRWLLASSAALVASLPLLVFAFIERNQISFLAHRQVVTPDAIFVTMWFGAPLFAIIAWTLILIATIGYAKDAVRGRSAGVPASPRLELLALAWLVIPVGILIAVSLVVADFTARYGTFAAPAAAVLMAIGLRRLARVRWAAPIAIVAVVAVTIPIWMSQRGPYSKNDSDWNDIASVIAANAIPGDAIVFDEAVRPSRRTRLAMDTKPSAFAAVTDVTLSAAYPERASWFDSAYSVRTAARLGRFDGVDRVWLVEYAIDGSADTSGQSQLEALGFSRVNTVPLHRSAVYLYTR